MMASRALFSLLGHEYPPIRRDLASVKINILIKMFRRNGQLKLFLHTPSLRSEWDVVARTRNGKLIGSDQSEIR